MGTLREWSAWELRAAYFVLIILFKKKIGQVYEIIKIYIVLCPESWPTAPKSLVTSLVIGVSFVLMS